jgi:hypothetical protein
MVMSPAGLEHENDCAGEDQEQLQTTDPSSRQRAYYSYIRTITASVQVESKINGRESQGVCRQDELIGGKLLVVK